MPLHLIRPGEEKGWLAAEPCFIPEIQAKHETIFTQGNGYLGQRAALDESYIGQTRNLLVSGTFDRFHESEVTELPNLPDVTNLEVFVNGAQFSMVRGTLESYSRTLNLYTAELTRKIIWQRPDGVRLHMRWQRMVSQDDVHIIAAAVEITPDQDVELRFLSGINCRTTNSGTQHMVEGSARVYDGTLLEYPVQTQQSEIQVVMHSTHRLLLNGELQEQLPKIVPGRRYLGASYTVKVAAGQTVRLEKISSVHTARDFCYAKFTQKQANEFVLEDSLREFRIAAQSSYDALQQCSAQAWQAFWEQQDVQVKGTDPADQLMIRFAIYHLNCMANRQDNRVGIAAKGLSGEGYKGHSFWDTEIFVFPYYLFTQPQAARRLLEYRYLCLKGARKKAKENGFNGAMYPWEAAWIEDGEVTPDWLGIDLVTGEMLPCNTGRLELHVTADVAYAVQEYFQATNDIEFMRSCGYEILIDTAKFWADRLEWNAENKRYELNHVIGPDEYQVDVNNNIYTNYMVELNLRLGLKALETVRADAALYAELDKRIGLDSLEELLSSRADQIYLPQADPKTGLLPQFDGYFNLKFLNLTKYKNAPRVAEIMKEYNFDMLRQYQAAKQADVVQLLYLRGDLFPEHMQRENYTYYEERTLHDSSLSKAIHSVLASDLNMPKEAYAMFQSAAGTDFGPEPDSCDEGIHSANMGGIWQDVVMGFGGARIWRGRLRFAPHLPESWQSLRYRLHWQGRDLYVTVTQDQLHIVNRGNALSFWLYDQSAVLAENGESTFQLEGGELKCKKIAVSSLD